MQIQAFGLEWDGAWSYPAVNPWPMLPHYSGARYLLEQPRYQIPVECGI